MSAAISYALCRPAAHDARWLAGTREPRAHAGQQMPERRLAAGHFEPTAALGLLQAALATERVCALRHRRQDCVRGVRARFAAGEFVDWTRPAPGHGGEPPDPIDHGDAPAPAAR